MAKVKLTNEHIYAIDDGEVLEIDGEEYMHHYDEEYEEDEHGRDRLVIYKRESDGKLFAFRLYFVRYGHKDYGLEPEYNGKEMFEVERKEVVSYRWVTVKEDE